MTQPPQNGFRLFQAAPGKRVQILQFLNGRTAGEFEPDQSIIHDVESGKLKLGFYDLNDNYLGPED